MCFFFLFFFNTVRYHHSMFQLASQTHHSNASRPRLSSRNMEKLHKQDIYQMRKKWKPPLVRWDARGAEGGKSVYKESESETDTCSVRQ